MKFTARVVKALSGGFGDGMRQRLKEAQAKHVNVGFPGGQDHEGTEMTVAQLARVHEFGAPSVGIPERPFMRQSLQNNRPKYLRLNRQNLRQMVAGDMSAEQALGQLGAMAQGDIQREIVNGEFAPLKPETIRRKGSSKPLIDSGQMRQSVTWELSDDRNQ